MADAAEHQDDSHSTSGHGGTHAPGGHGAEDHHEGAPEWLISFADNVALMMGFFVILLAMNMAKPSLGGIGGEGENPVTQETPEMLDFVLAVREAFNTPVDINSTDPREATLRARLRQRLSQGESIDSAPDGQKHDVQAPRTSDYVAPVGIIPFDVTSADIPPTGKKTAAQVAEQLRGTRMVTEIRGYVSAAEAYRDPDRGMALAYQRALAVARLLIDNGMKWGQLRVVACADNDPIRPRADDTDQHRTNQRVEIVVTQETTRADQFNASGGEVPAPVGRN